ncbi:DUF6492 family protein [Roseibium marinum]|uniref:Glycosyl transferase family 2 n=1 Tax=Roseibium marinum TaxID=281252 RepID=A0A2S3V2W2_9HYPH|nr:DUF6492 family protein [Roseibium marinum]POF34314.1 hypothetical protein CLV41_101768 [Roseibium marinum]
MQTPSVSIVTPSYHNDLRRCELLCETIDRLVTGFDHHFIVVGDEDLEIFRHLSGPKRSIVPSSDLLPRFWPLPKWRGRRYWWSPRIRLPVYGWHLQQLRKFAMTADQESDRVLFIDSDGVFCRPTDLRKLAGRPKSPLFYSGGDINPSRPNHVRWWKNAHKILGIDVPALPGDDFIGPMIVWERQTVKALLARIESVCGCPWWAGLARQRHFSEYLIYGIAVASDPALAERHELISISHCLTYWGGPQLDKAGLTSFMDGLQSHHHAITIQSHTETPLQTIREVVLEQSERSGRV